MTGIVGRFRDVLYTGDVDPGRMAVSFLTGAVAFVAALTLFGRASADLAKDV